MLEWKATPEEMELIGRIYERASKVVGANKTAFMMDIEATHCNGCKLDLHKLLKFANSDFQHDIVGINKYLDRGTGKLTSCFVPRCSA